MSKPVPLMPVIALSMFLMGVVEKIPAAGLDISLAQWIALPFGLFGALLVISLLSHCADRAFGWVK